MSNIEQTLSIIKPDAVERNLTDEIKSVFIKPRKDRNDLGGVGETRDDQDVDLGMSEEPE